MIPIFPKMNPGLGFIDKDVFQGSRRKGRVKKGVNNVYKYLEIMVLIAFFYL